MTKEIAVYGKGGIGKSTISANLSAALAEHAHVLQIGCDPKHDSTRLLTGGRKITPILDYIRDTGPADYRLQDILTEGFRGIGCMEAGGPRPGVGCAGRGIITAFDLLEQFRVKDGYDYVVYDVLGDVVCGGFAVPIRREYADTIFLVTSGEFMSIYAANNILRGILNYDGDQQRRVAGIIYNSRKVADETARVEKFAQAVGLPIFARIPRHQAFAEAEKAGRTVVELADTAKAGQTRAADFSPAQIFREMADRIRTGLTLRAAKPLTDETLEELILGTPGTAAGTPGPAAGSQGPVLVPGAAPEEEAGGTDQAHQKKIEEERGAAKTYDPGIVSKNVIRDEPLHGCAFNGAMCMSVHLRDAAVIAHAPESCMYLSWQTISSTGRRALFERGSLMPSSLMPNLTGTDMDESDMVFGGTEKLLETVQRVKGQEPAPKAIIIVSSCPAGIIGDDIDQAKTLSSEDCPVLTIKADGNLSGDYLQGMLMTYTQLAKQLVDPEVPTAPDTVNIVFEKVVAKNTETSYQTIRGFLQQMGIRVNCRFLCETTVDEVRNFCSAPLNLLGYKDYTGKLLQTFFEENYGCRFYDRQLPVGFEETADWLRGVAGFFDGEEDRRQEGGRGETACRRRREIAEKLIEEQASIYQKRIAAAREKLAGKRLMIVTFNHQMDWILSAALAAGMEVVKICVYNFSQDEGFRTYLPEASGIEVEENFDPARRDEEVLRLRPDIMLTNYESGLPLEGVLTDTIPMCPDVGFFTGLEIVERWTRLNGGGREGSWKKDADLVAKYCSR